MAAPGGKAAEGSALAGGRTAAVAGVVGGARGAGTALPARARGGGAPDGQGGGRGGGMHAPPPTPGTPAERAPANAGAPAPQSGGAPWGRGPSSAAPSGAAAWPGGTPGGVWGAAPAAAPHPSAGPPPLRGAAGTTGWPLAARSRHRPALLAAPPAPATTGAGGAAHTATMGWAEAVRLHLPPTPSAAAAADTDGGRGDAAAPAVASPTRPGTPPPSARVASITGWPVWFLRPGRPRSPYRARRLPHGPPSTRGPPAPVPLGVPRRASAVVPPRAPAPPGRPPAAAAPSPVVPTDTAAPGLHRPTGEAAAAVTAAWRRWLGGDAPTAQRDLSRPAALAAQARLWRGASLARRARMAACEGGGAGLFLGALPTNGPSGTRIGGDDMRAAVRMWLGAAARLSARPLRCRCGVVVPADGGHFPGECPEQVGSRTRRHHAISHLVADALRASARWMAVELELRLGKERQGSLRPDLCATRAGSGVRVWGDVSVVSPLRAAVLSRVVANPLQAAAAVRRLVLVGGVGAGRWRRRPVTGGAVGWAVLGRAPSLRGGEAAAAMAMRPAACATGGRGPCGGLRLPQRADTEVAAPCHL